MARRWPAALPAGLLGLRRNSLRRRGGPACLCRCCWGVLCGAAKDRGAACRWRRPALLGRKHFSAPEPRGRSPAAVTAEERPLRKHELSLTLQGRQLVVFVANDKTQTLKQKQKLANSYPPGTDLDGSPVHADLSEQIGGVRMSYF